MVARSDRSGHGEEPRQDPRDVGIGRRHARAEGEAGYRRRGVRTESRESLQGRGVRRQFSVMVRHDPVCRAPEISRPRVIAQAGPCRQHALFARAGEARHIGEAREELLVSGLHRRDGGLLEHHLRDPDPVGIGDPTPGERTLLLAVPGQKLSADDSSLHASRCKAHQGVYLKLTRRGCRCRSNVTYVGPSSFFTTIDPLEVSMLAPSMLVALFAFTSVTGT